MHTVLATLKDNDFKENNIQFALEHLESKITDEIKHIYFNLKLTYENSSLEKKIILFENDIQNLNISCFTNNSPDYFFTEPDIWLTVIQHDHNDLILYLNFDSGLNYSNMATESGYSIRINTNKDSLSSFIQNLKSYI